MNMFSTVPVSIGYRQSLFGYNSLKWDRRIEPLRYAEAKKLECEGDLSAFLQIYLFGG